MKISRRKLLIGTAAGAAAAQTATSAQQSKSGATTSGRRASSQPMPGRRFTKDSLREIAFPLGGIGTGTVSLGGRGDFRDWEIFNRPNKGGVLPFTFVALHLSGGGLAKPLIRVVERQPHPPFTGSDGVARDTGLGLPRFREAVFTGSYPFALTYNIRNRATLPVNAALAFSIMNPVGYDGVTRLSSRYAPFFGANLNEFRTENGLSGLHLSSTKYPSDSPRYGSLAVVTEAGD